MGFLVGGFNPFLKNISQIGSFPQVRVENKKCLKPPPRFLPYWHFFVSLETIIRLSLGPGNDSQFLEMVVKLVATYTHTIHGTIVRIFTYYFTIKVNDKM